MTPLEQELRELMRVYDRATAEAIRLLNSSEPQDMSTLLAVVQLGEVKKNFSRVMISLAEKEIKALGCDPEKIVDRMIKGEDVATILPEQVKLNLKSEDENVINGKGAEIVNLDSRRKK
jgi:hypothetical protein